MCDEHCRHAFRPSAMGNMNRPFYQRNHYCGILHSNNAPSSPSWASIDNLTPMTQQHESTSTSTPPASPRNWRSPQNSYVFHDADQHDLALQSCMDPCGECKDPTCDEPDCEADVIPCTDQNCSKPPVLGACHGNNTICADNLPDDVLTGAASLTAIQKSSVSYGQVSPPQAQRQIQAPCEWIADGWFNPVHIHGLIPNCGPHDWTNLNHALFHGGHQMMAQSLETIHEYPFVCDDQDCQFGLSYDGGAQAVAHSSLDHQVSPNKGPSMSPISPKARQSFSSLSHDSTSSTSTPFTSPHHRGSDSTFEQMQLRPLSTAGSFSTLPTCLWETSHASICGHTFETAGQLQSHIQHVHTSPLRKAHGFTCQWKGCPRREKGGDSFAQRSKLDRHIQSHTGYKASICTICGQQFSTTQSLVLHQRTHSGEKPHKCLVPGCGYAAAQASQLTMHNRTKHTKEKPLKCDYPGCNACFAESSNLSKHKKIHLPEAPCLCPICLKSFNRDDQLKRHMKTHTKKAHEERGRNLSVLSETLSETKSFSWQEQQDFKVDLPALGLS